jgi:NAD(P)-dependent dehydrogenase (short-subunit alcohol dehydrogenase family)
VIEHFDNRVSVVTGAAGGIGRAIVESLTDLGMRVALVDVDEEALAELVSLVSHPARCFTYVADVSDHREVESLAKRVVQDLATPNLLVNNAGRLGPHDKKSWEFSNDDWEGVLSVNLYGAINCVRAFLPDMRAASEPTHIVNVGSAMWAVGFLGAYAASKRALGAYTETLELELAAEGASVGVSLVCPGSVQTNLNRQLRASGLARSTPSDWQEPAVVAAAVIDAARSDRFYIFTDAERAKARTEKYQQRVMDAFS